MVLKNKYFIFIVLFPLLLLASINQASALASNFNSNEKVTSNQKLNTLAGNVTIIVYNAELYYTPDQISAINNTINNVLKADYPSLTFNLTVIPNINSNTSITTIFSDIVQTNHANYVLFIGAIVQGTEGSFFTSLSNWSQGTNYTNIKQLAMINYMRDQAFISQPANKVNSITFASYNLLQAGFMSGVKASFLTKTNKIGLILDHSMQVSFNDKLTASSLNRNDFVTGFIAGIKYSAEFLLKKSNIEIKTESYDFASTSKPDIIMESNVAKLHDFGADTVFNMESGLNNVFLQKAASYSMSTGLLGANDSKADFSFVQNNQVILENILSDWNSSSINYNLKYTLQNSTVMSLSSMKDSRLIDVQKLLLNNTITVPSVMNIEGVPGFELISSLTIFAVIFLRRKLKN